MSSRAHFEVKVEPFSSLILFSPFVHAQPFLEAHRVNFNALQDSLPVCMRVQRGHMCMSVCLTLNNLDHLLCESIW